MPFHGYQGRTQYAVFWPRAGTDGDGLPTVSNVAQELLVRWDGETSWVKGGDGLPLKIDATAAGFTSTPVVGGKMWLGRLDDLPGTSQIPATDVMIIVHVAPVPDIRGRSTYITAYLQRLGDTLGTTVPG